MPTIELLLPLGAVAFYLWDSLQLLYQDELVVERDAGWIVLVDSKAEKQTIPEESIESLKDSDVSIMPEGLVAKMSPQDVRDLFAYLQSSGETP